MNSRIRRYVAAFMAMLTLVMMMGMTVSADSSRPDYFDFGETVMKINAGESKTISFRTPYDWTYFITGATSKKTYLSGNYKAGTSQITFNIGEDETGKNVFFHFYVADERVASTDVHDAVEIYVQPPKNTAAPANAPETTAAPAASTTTPKNVYTFADGCKGYAELINDGKVVMLYNESGTALASFSVSNNGLMKLTPKGVVINDGNYFDIGAPSNGTLNISESDKQVMLVHGFKGIYLNGNKVNW